MKPALLLVGLGNPGSAYERTRHNVGFQAIDALALSFGEGDWREVSKFTARVQEARVVTAPALLVKPLTYMNLSGETIRKLTDYYKLNPADQLIVLCDDIDLPLGEVRMRMKGGPGTHNGLTSIVDAIGEEFPRIRIGLGAPPAGLDLATWVLSAQAPEEEAALQEAFKKLPTMVREFVMGLN